MSSNGTIEFIIGSEEMSARENEKLWIAVYVWRGLVEDVRVYRKESSARRQERSWRRSMNPDYDETYVSEAVIRGRKGVVCNR